MLLRSRLLLVVWMAFASLLFSMDAMTAETRIAVLDPPPRLLDAISVALSPWGLRVLPVTGTPSPGELSSATTTARVIASAQGAGAVAWVTLSPARQALLWLYDAQTEQMTVRSLSVSPPFDDASAAAVALTLKTLLRATAIAPEAERPGPELRTATSTPTASATPAPTPTATSTPTSTSTLRAHSLRVDAFATGHFPTGTDPSVALRAGLGFAWWPAPWRERFGFGIDLRAGASGSFSPRSFVGTFSDTVAGASARARLGGEPFSVEVLTGPSLHWTSLSGTATATGRSTTVQRLDPAFDIVVVPQVSLGARARIGLFLGSTVLLRTQRYSLDTDVLLRVPAVAFDMGARASLAFD